jgi:penicillin-insensitive murein endopeptidase
MAALRVWVFCLFGVVSGPVAAETALTPWQTVKTPALGPSRAIGDYSAGCVQGAQALPLDGEGYQVMHPSRVRHFGHPELIGFIQTLGRGALAAGLGPVMVGDLSQPRGGRASGGHASHQTGLDVDLWFWLPKQAQGRALTRAERERIKARTVLDGKAGTMQRQWAPRVAQLLRLTANDARVARVFVHPIIKRDLCASTSGERAWLGKIRPWHGHDDHFHVRLACPADSTDCLPQAPVPAGDGCGDELAWWFSEEARADREDAKKKYQAKVVRGPRVPPQCFALIGRGAGETANTATAQ